MGVIKLYVERFGGQFPLRHPIPAEHLIEVQAVYCAERVQPEDRRNGTLILNVGQSAKRNRVLVAPSPLRNLKARPLDIPNRQFEAFSSLSELICGLLHAM